MARPSTGLRQKAEQRGRRAEWFAARALQLKGYQIIASRARTPVGEIDLIAKRGGVVAFVEVKQRALADRALIAVPERNWHRIAAAADVWATRHPHLRTLDWRFDLIAVQPWRWPQHYPDFWRP